MAAGWLKEAPTLETERLRLRAFRTGDVEPVAAMNADEVVMRHLGAAPLTREDAWRRMLCGPGMWALMGYGYWIVERRSDDLVVGQVGFADFKRAIEPSIEGLPEMGWVFARHAHGQGYASEAVAAALAWIDEALSPVEVPAIISPDNHPSIRVAERAGFGAREETLYKGEPILLFRRYRR